MSTALSSVDIHFKFSMAERWLPQLPGISADAVGFDMVGKSGNNDQAFSLSDAFQ